MEHETWLKDFMVFLLAAGLIVPLFHRARIGAVLGFLLIGVVVGPYGFGLLAGDYPWLRYLTIEDRERVAPFAELGVMFLLFIVGLELSLSRLWAMRRLMLGLGSAQFLVTALAVGAIIAWAGAGAPQAIVLGLCLAMSSTAIVVQLLEEEGRTATSVGQVAIAILLFQDVMVAPVLFVTTVLGRGVENILAGLGEALLQAGIALAAIAAVGFYLLRPLFRLAGQTGSRELIMAMALLVVVSMAAVTGRYGMSVALGAFLAGVLLSETEYRHQINIDLAPVKGLLLGLFFITVGMTIDVRVAWAQVGTIVTAVTGLFVLKALVIYASCSAFKLKRPVNVEAAILLAQAGEFGFVVIALGGTNGLFDPAQAQLATIIVGLGMMATPGAAFVGGWLGRRLQESSDGAGMDAINVAELSDHVIIGGYGRVGRIVARMLEAENIPYVALDTNAGLVAEARKPSAHVYFGDASRSEFLAHVAASRARAFVVTVNNAIAAERMVAAAQSECPKAPVFARAVDADHAARLLKLGAVGIIPEAVEASVQLGGRLLEALGLPDEAVERRIDQARAEELQRLGSQIDKRATM